MLRKMKMRNALLAGGLLIAAMPGMAHAQSTTPSDQQAQYEVWYLENMIDHQAEAIEAASLSAQRTNSPVVLDASEDVIANRSAEISTMQGWLSSWYGIDYQPNPADANELNELASYAGPAYDYAFLVWMRNHDATAVSASEQAMNWAYHPELTYAANTIANRESEEIAQLDARGVGSYVVVVDGGNASYQLP